jgi:integrase
MPSGAAVIRYEGPRGVSWRIKFMDADGRQVKETLGREPEWDRRKAERTLGARLADVEKGMRKPKRRTFNDLADEFEQVGLGARPRKKSTVIDYKATLRNHLRPSFGTLDLERLSRSPEAFERYAADKIGGGLSPKTVKNHLVLAGPLFRTARRWRWVSENPLDLVETPAMPDAETETIDAATIADLIAAYRELEADPPDDTEAAWFAVARRMTVVALSTGLRRGERLGLRWQDVDFLERRVSVRQQYVRNEITTPKSRAGRRAVPLGPVAARALEEQYQATRYREDDCIVFSHPALGTPLDASKLGRHARIAMRKAGVPDSFRPWHGLRHTALTETAAAGVPGMFVQAKAGHAHGSTTERYLHAHRTTYPDAAELAEARLFASEETR